MLAPKRNLTASGVQGFASVRQVATPRFPRLAKQTSGNEDLLKLADAWLRLYRFQTRRLGESLDAPPRTVGQTCMIVRSGSQNSKGVGAREAVEVCLRGPEEPSSTEAAKEKVVFCSRQGETSVYQADRQNRAAALCACGNATAASTAMLAHWWNKDEVRQRVQLADGQVEVHGGVTRSEDGGWRVQQSWRGIEFRALPAKLGGREAVICTGTLNDYVIIRLADAAELEAFGLDEVLGLWREARQYSGFENPLQSRLVALAPNGARPYARFFTCGRMHPGAPLTGLATLALGASQAGWLGGLLKGGEIEHRRGVDALPAVRATPAGDAIQFSAIHVLLHGAGISYAAVR